MADANQSGRGAAAAVRGQADSARAAYPPRERAHDAWVLLGRIEAQAEEVGGPDLVQVLARARLLLDRRWGPFGGGRVRLSV